MTANLEHGITHLHTQRGRERKKAQQTYMEPQTCTHVHVQREKTSTQTYNIEWHTYRENIR